MCLLHWFTEAFLAVPIVQLLSTPRAIGFGSGVAWRSTNKRESHIDSLTAMRIAMYSASQVDVATQVCFLDLQDTAPHPTKNRKPLVDFGISLHPA